MQKDVVFGLQQGTKVLGEIHKEMGGIEHVEKLMGETADAVAYQQVGSFLSLRGQVREVVANAVCVSRRLARCWEGGYRIRMRMR